VEIKVRNVNHALSEALWKLKACGVESDSRNGPVIAFPEPVMTTYLRPKERVLFWGERDANPIFHLMESIWMMAGRRDVAFPQMFNSRIGQYSDNGEVFNAAYGHRWRRHFGRDQLLDVIYILSKDPTTRQAVMQMWDPIDLLLQTKDKACNMSVVFDCVGGSLNMTIMNRSNDIWFGAYGANAVHFSILQEFVAKAIGLPVGVYRQFSNNLHLYTELYDAKKHLTLPPDPGDYDAYLTGIEPMPIMGKCDGDYLSWLKDAERFCDNPFADPDIIPYTHLFFREVAYPMAMVSKVRKTKTGDGLYWAARIMADDWRLAVYDWIERREGRKDK